MMDCQDENYLVWRTDRYQESGRGLGEQLPERSQNMPAVMDW